MDKEVQRAAIIRGMEIQQQIDAVKDDPEWIKFCEFADLWQSRTDALPPTALDDFESEISD